MYLLNPSTTIRKSNGAKGHPCLSPRPNLKKVDATPLISTSKETEEMMLITHVIKGTKKPILDIITCKYVQFTRSYTLDKSILSTTDFKPLQWMECKPS